MATPGAIPRLLVTTVVRGSRQHDCQAGVFLIDLEQQRVNLALDWAGSGIDWQGRGFELGLRCALIVGESVYLAASDELFAFSPDFQLQSSWRNPHLKHCRAMAVHEGKLFLASAGYDSILAFDLDEQAFDWAMHLDKKHFRFSGAPFDPNGDDGPLPLNKLELTDVHCSERGMYVCGLNTGGLLHFNGETILMTAELPPATHNARPFRKGVLFIDNEVSALRYSGRGDGREDRSLPLPKHDPADLLNAEMDFSGEARPGFGRGLCVLTDRAVAAGTSPATVTLYDLQENRRMFSVNLSRDVRTAIHDIVIWPF